MRSHPVVGGFDVGSFVSYSANQVNLIHWRNLRICEAHMDGLQLRMTGRLPTTLLLIKNFLIEDIPARNYPTIDYAVIPIERPECKSGV